MVLKPLESVFLKDNVQLSRSVDNRSSLLTEVREYFKPDSSKETLSGYSLVSKQESNVDGIPTERYTFAKPSIISIQEERNSQAKTVRVRVFNLTSTDSSFYTSGGSRVDSATHILVSSSEEDFEGIKTSVFTYESRDYNSKTTNEFGRTIIERVEQTDSSTYSLQSQSATYTVDSVSDLRILSQTVENNDNEVNRRITTFTTVGIDNIQEDIVGSQKAIVITKIGAEPTTTEAATYSDMTFDGADDWSIARKNNSRQDGLDVFTYTFLLDNTILSQTEDKVGSQKSIVAEVYNPDVTVPGLEVFGGSDVEGSYFQRSSLQNGKVKFSNTTAFGGTSIQWDSSQGRWEMQEVSVTHCFSAQDTTTPPTDGEAWTTFTTDDADAEVEYMLERDFDVTEVPDGQLASFELSNRYAESGYDLASVTHSNVDGIPTVRFTYLKSNVQLSRTVDNESPLLTEVREYFNPDASKESLSGYSLLDKRESDVDGIPTERYTFAKDNVTLSTSEEKIGSQLAIVREVFNGTPGTPVGYAIADESVSSVDGIPTRRFRFLKNNVQLSRTVDNESPLKTEVREYFNPDSSKQTLANYSLINKAESNVDGIPTERYTFAKDNVVLSRRVDSSGPNTTVVLEKFNNTSNAATLLTEAQSAATAEIPASQGSETYELINVASSNVDGIDTQRFTFIQVSAGRVISTNRVLENEFTLKPAYQVTTINKTPHAHANDLATAASGNTADLTDDITIAVNASSNTHQVLFVDLQENLGSKPKTFTSTLINVNFNAGNDVLSDGILVNQYDSQETFYYPGEIGFDIIEKGNDVDLNIAYKSAPVQGTVESTVYEFIQSGNTIASADYNYQSAHGLWSTNNWAALKLNITGNNDALVYSESQVFKGYRINRSSFKLTRAAIGLDNVVMKYQGNTYTFGTAKGAMDLDINQGPTDPIGKKWVLDISIEPIGTIFESGGNNTPLYKKTIVVSDTVPIQTTNSVPYT